MINFNARLGISCLVVHLTKLHSTQKPESLLYRILLASTNKDDFIFDPFLGSGTTAVVAKKMGRKYLGIEREEKYFKVAKQRLEKTKKIEDHYLDTVSYTHLTLPTSDLV